MLISILSALHDGVFTLAEVQGELEMLFEKQYILTETVTMQIRYRTKMMVIIGRMVCRKLSPTKNRMNTTSARSS